MLFIFDYIYNYNVYKSPANYKLLENKVMKLDPAEARYHQDLEYNKVDFSIFVLTIMLLVLPLVIATIAVACTFNENKLNYFEKSLLSSGLTNPQVTSVFTATIFCTIPMSIDLSMDVFLFLHNLKYQNIVENERYISVDFVTRTLLIISLLCVPVTVLGIQNTNLKCGAYVLTASFQNVFLAGAVSIATSKKMDPIYNWMFTLVALFLYAIYQLVDVFEQIGLHVGPTVYVLVTISRIWGILGIIMIAVASMYRISHRQRLGLSLLSNDCNGLFHIMPLVLGAIITELITGVFFKGSGGTQKTTTVDILIYNQYMALALILILALVPKRIATQIAQEKSAELKTAYDILRGTYSPLKFVKKYLTKLFTIDQLQDTTKSRIANYMVLACNRMLSRIDIKQESLKDVAVNSGAEEQEINGGIIETFNDNLDMLTNQQLERELDIESLASSETYKLESFEIEFPPF